jgi:O-antigen ligase
MAATTLRIEASRPRSQSSPSTGSAAFEAALDQIAFGCMWALILAIPWEGNTTIGGLVISRWLGVLVVLVAGIRWVVRGRLRRLTPLHYVMAAFVLWAGLTLVWSAAPDMTLSRLGSYAQLFVLVWLIWELAPEEKRWAALLRAYSLGAAIASINTIRNLLGADPDEIAGPNFIADGRYAPEGFDQNELALMLALSVPITIYLITRRQSRLLEVLCWIQLVLCATAILLTGSRAGVICLALASTMMLFAIPHLPGWKKTACVIAVSCAVLLAAIAVPATTWDRLLTLGSEVSEGTLNHRTSIWAAGLTVFRDHALLGVGAGAFGPSVLPLIDIDYIAHNSFLSVLVELGVVGELILLSLLAGMLYVVLRMRSPQKWLWLIMLATWSAGVLSLTWEYRKPTWFLFGMLAAQAGMPRMIRRTFYVRRRRARLQP